MIGRSLAGLAHRVDPRDSIDCAERHLDRLARLLHIGHLREYAPERHGRERDAGVDAEEIGERQVLVLDQIVAVGEGGRLNEEQDGVGDAVEQGLHVQIAQEFARVAAKQRLELSDEVALSAQANDRLDVLDDFDGQPARLLLARLLLALLVRHRLNVHHARHDVYGYEAENDQAELPVEHEANDDREANARNGLAEQAEQVRGDALAKGNAGRQASRQDGRFVLVQVVIGHLLPQVRLEHFDADALDEPSADQRERVVEQDGRGQIDEGQA